MKCLQNKLLQQLGKTGSHSSSVLSVAFVCEIRDKGRCQKHPQGGGSLYFRGGTDYF